MTLNIETKTTHHVAADDLDVFVSNLFGVPFDTAADLESGNDQAHEFDSVDGYIDDYAQSEIDRFLAGEPVWDATGFILDYLCKMGQIPAGHYIVLVSW